MSFWKRRAAKSAEQPAKTSCAPVAGLHQLEHLRLADAAAPVGAADDVGVQAGVLLEPVEVDVRERAGALAEEHQRARGAVAVRGRHARTPSAVAGG